MDPYILKYLVESTDDAWTKRYYDYLKCDLDFRFWAQGTHFTHSWDVYRAKYLASLNRPQWRKVLGNVKRYLLGCYKKRNPATPPELVLPKNGYNVLSIVDVPIRSQEAIRQCGINYIPIGINHGCVEYDMPAMLAMVDFYLDLRDLTFSEIIAPEMIERMRVLYDNLQEELSRYAFDAVFVRTSELFYEKILIDIFKSLNKPSITLLHGLPGVYTKATEYRSEYLLVWSEIIRENFIAKGYDPKHVLVAGNYKYTTMPHIDDLRCSSEDVLILTTAPYEDHQHEWEYDKFCINDRSLLVGYLYNVEHVLKANGINHARLRPHPHTNKVWLQENIDMDFYTFDYEPIITSLKHATMCVGTTSTTMIEALMCGVSYLVYEPGEGDYSFSGYPLVPPFNKEYKHLKVAYNEEQLSELIQTQYKPDANRLLNDFLQPFNPQIIKQILDERKA